MSKCSLRITFNGSDFDDHTMDIKDLAPSLLALNELFEASNSIANKGGTVTSVKITGFEPNCFTIPITIDQSLIESFVSLLSNQEIVNVTGLTALLGFQDQVGLLQVLFWIKGRQLTEVVEKPNGKTEIYIKKESLEVESFLWGLLKNFKVRRSIEKFSSPIRDREGAEDVTIQVDDNPPVIINKEKAKNLIAPVLKDEILSENDETFILEIKQIIWGEGNKWRFSKGSGSFWAVIVDEQWNIRRRAGLEKFGEGDHIKATLKTIQYMSPDGLKEKHEITEVMTKIPVIPTTEENQLTLGLEHDDR